MLSGDQASRLLTGLIPFLVKALARPPSILGSGNSLFSNAAARHTHKGKRRKSTGVGGGFDPFVSLPRPRSESEAAAVARETTEAEVLRVVCRLMEITANVDSHLR